MPPRASAIVNEGTETLTSLTEGMPILYAGNQVTRVPAELAAAFRPGDRLVVVQTTGDLLHIPSADWTTARAAVDAATQAFKHMGIVTDHTISRFYDEFARRLSDEASFEPIATANRTDVDRARRRGRSEELDTPGKRALYNNLLSGRHRVAKPTAPYGDAEKDEVLALAMGSTRQ